MGAVGADTVHILSSEPVASLGGRRLKGAKGTVKAKVNINDPNKVLEQATLQTTLTTNLQAKLTNKIGPNGVTVTKVTATVTAKQLADPCSTVAPVATAAPATAGPCATQ